MSFLNGEIEPVALHTIVCGGSGGVVECNYVIKCQGQCRMHIGHGRIYAGCIQVRAFPSVLFDRANEA